MDTASDQKLDGRARKAWEQRDMVGLGRPGSKGTVGLGRPGSKGIFLGGMLKMLHYTESDVFFKISSGAASFGQKLHLPMHTPHRPKLFSRARLHI